MDAKVCEENLFSNNFAISPKPFYNQHFPIILRVTLLSISMDNKNDIFFYQRSKLIHTPGYFVLYYLKAEKFECSEKLDI